MQAIPHGRKGVRMVRAVCARPHNRKWSDLDWQRGTASVCRTIQTSASGWTFYDTKRKRSRRAVKLQNFVLEALDDLRGPHETGHDLVFHKGGQPLRQRKIKSNSGGCLRRLA